MHIQPDTRSIRAHWGLPHLWLYRPGPTPARQPTITCGEAPARTSIPSSAQRGASGGAGGRGGVGVSAVGAGPPRRPVVGWASGVVRDRPTTPPRAAQAAGRGAVAD